MHLSKLTLNPRSRAVQSDLADCQQLHRTVMAGFPAVERSSARQDLGILYRADVSSATARITLLVQARERPDYGSLASDYLLEAPVSTVLDPLLDSLNDGARCRFRLRANPTKRVHQANTSQGERWGGRRIDLRDDESRQQWLERKAEQAGFRLVAVQGRPDIPAAAPTGSETVIGFRADQSGQRRRLTFGAVVFDGRLEVIDAAAFRRAIEAGIGSGKAYGFGLLSIAPAG